MPLGEEIDAILSPLLRIFQTSLIYRLNGHVTLAYIEGSAEMTSWGKTKGGKPLFFKGPPLEEAISYASKHCATLVTKIDEETKRQLRQIIADGIENKRGVDGIARDIRAQFQDMSRTRAQVISRTETADALEQAFMDRAEKMGITGKEWITHDPCDICAGNGDEGIVPLDHVFSGGVDRPPQHPQ